VNILLISLKFHKKIYILVSELLQVDSTAQTTKEKNLVVLLVKLIFYHLFRIPLPWRV